MCFHWTQLERVKAVKLAQRVAEVERAPTSVASHTTELHRLLDDCQRSLQELQHTLITTAAPMAYHRKHQLHLLLKQLPPPRMAEAVAVLSRCDPTLRTTTAAGEAWAMDLDRLHPFTLRQLERHAQV